MLFNRCIYSTFRRRRRRGSRIFDYEMVFVDKVILGSEVLPIDFFAEEWWAKWLVARTVLPRIVGSAGGSTEDGRSSVW